MFLPYVVKYREHYLRREEWKGGDQVDDDNVWINWQVSSANNCPRMIDCCVGGFNEILFLCMLRLYSISVNGW